MSKAQSSIEFMIIFIILVLALLVSLWIGLMRVREVSTAQTDLEVERLLNDASNKINTAYLEGHGFSINLTMPNKIFGLNYTVQIISNYIYLTINNNTYPKPLLTQNISGTLKKGENLIKNVRGDVLIT